MPIHNQTDQATVLFNPGSPYMIFEGSAQILEQIKDIIDHEVKASFGGGPPFYSPIDGTVPPQDGKDHRIVVPAGLCAWLATSKSSHLLFPRRNLLDLRGTGEVQLYTGRATELEQAGLLRPYQAQAVRQALSSWMSRGIIEAPTGSGKTRICAALMACTGGRWLYLVSNVQLARQSAREFDEVLPGMCQVTGTQVDRLASSYSQIDISTGYDGLLVDECHGLPAATRMKSFWRIEAAKVFGLSATPLERQDQRNAVTVAAIGPVVATVDPVELENSTYLSRGKVVHLIPKR